MLKQKTEKKKSGGSDRKDRGRKPVAFEVPDSLHSQILVRVKKGNFTSIAEYFRSLARRDIDSAA